MIEASFWYYSTLAQVVAAILAGSFIAFAVLGRKLVDFRRRARNWKILMLFSIVLISFYVILNSLRRILEGGHLGNKIPVIDALFLIIIIIGFPYLIFRLYYAVGKEEKAKERWNDWRRNKEGE